MQIDTSVKRVTLFPIFYESSESQWKWFHSKMVNMNSTVSVISAEFHSFCHALWLTLECIGKVKRNADGFFCVCVRAQDSTGSTNCENNKWIRIQPEPDCVSFKLDSYCVAVWHQENVCLQKREYSTHAIWQRHNAICSKTGPKKNSWTSSHVVAVI